VPVKAGDANAQEYPVDVSMAYKNINGEETISSPFTIGIPVGEEMRFACSPDLINLTTGADIILEVPYRNDANDTAYGVQARISALDPFSSIDDTSYLGDIGPGEIAVACYHME